MIRDAIFFASAAIVIYGAYQVHRPTGYLVAGGFGMLLWAALCARAKK